MTQWLSVLCCMGTLYLRAGVQFLFYARLLSGKARAVWLVQLVQLVQLIICLVGFCVFRVQI